MAMTSEEFFAQLYNKNPDIRPYVQPIQQSQEPEEDDASYLSDVGHRFAVGLDTVGQQLGRGLQWAGMERAGEAVEGFYEDRAKERQSHVSPEYMARAEKEFITTDDQGEYHMGGGWTDPLTITDKIASSAGSTALGMGTGIGIGAGLAKTGISKGLAYMIGGGLGEGVVGGVASGKEAEDIIMNAPEEQLVTVPEYQHAYHSLPQEMNDAERRAKAREMVAKDEALTQGLKVGAFTAAAGAPSGYVFGRVIGGEVGRNFGTTALKQAILEGPLQETPQSMYEKYAQNVTKSKLDPDQDLFEGVLNAGAEGGVVGGVMGAGLGGGGHAIGSAASLGHAKTFTAEAAEDLGSMDNERLGRLHLFGQQIARMRPTDENVQNALGNIELEVERRAENTRVKQNLATGKKVEGKDIASPQGPQEAHTRTQDQFAGQQSAPAKRVDIQDILRNFQPQAPTVQPNPDGTWNDPAYLEELTRREEINAMGRPDYDALPTGEDRAQGMLPYGGQDFILVDESQRRDLPVPSTAIPMGGMDQQGPNTPAPNPPMLSGGPGEDVQPAIHMKKDGKPFTEKGAKIAATGRSKDGVTFEPVEVEGGWGIKEKAAVPPLSLQDILDWIASAATFDLKHTLASVEDGSAWEQQPELKPFSEQIKTAIHASMAEQQRYWDAKDAERAAAKEAKRLADKEAKRFPKRDVALETIEEITARMGSIQRQIDDLEGSSISSRSDVWEQKNAKIIALNARKEALWVKKAELLQQAKKAEEENKKEQAAKSEISITENPVNLVQRVESSEDSLAEFMKIGGELFPDLRLQEHEEAGRWAYMVAKGEASQEDFDATIEQWKRENRFVKAPAAEPDEVAEIVQEDAETPQSGEPVILSPQEATAEDMLAEWDRHEAEEQEAKEAARPREEDFESAREYLAALHQWREETGTVNEYEQKREDRANRMEERSDRAKQKSSEHHASADKVADGIPFGQPILVGHHSEARARRDQDKIWKQTDKAVEESKKADYYSQRAASIRNNDAISSDDEDAIIKLKAKIEEAQELQDKMKAVNRAVKKKDVKAGDAELRKMGYSDKVIERYRTPDDLGRIGFPGYALTNNNANINRMKKRLASLEQTRNDETREYKFDGGTIVDDVEGNRVRIFFDGKPDAETRENLKKNRFLWARSVGAWQKKRGAGNLEQAKNITGYNESQKQAKTTGVENGDDTRGKGRLRTDSRVSEEPSRSRLDPDGGPDHGRKDGPNAGRITGRNLEEVGQTGNPVTVRYPGGEDQAVYQVVEIDDIVPSNDAENHLEKNPEYPFENERRYHDRNGQERNKVFEYAQQFDPDYMLSDSPDVHHGAPVVTKEGYVLGGNGRAITLGLTHEKFPAHAKTYNDRLVAKADQFGVDPEAIEVMARPILVRRLVDDVSAKDGAKRIASYNQDVRPDVDLSSAGISRGRFISEKTFSLLAKGLDAYPTLRKFLDSPGSRDFIQSMLDDGAFEKSKLGTYYKSGELTPEGKNYVERALRGRVITDPDLITKLPSSLEAKLDRALPALVRVMARGGEWDLSKHFNLAIQHLVRFGSSKFKALDDYFRTQEMMPIEGKRNLRVRIIADMLYNLGKKNIANRLNTWAKRAASVQRGSGLLPGMESLVPNPRKSLELFVSENTPDSLRKQIENQSDPTKPAKPRSDQAKDQKVFTPNKTDHVDWFVAYTDQPGIGRTTETKRFSTLAEAKAFSKGKHGYITRHSDGGNSVSTKNTTAKFVEYFGDFEPTAQEGKQIQHITGEKAPASTKSSDKIEDFGETIHGARKDYAKALIDKQNNAKDLDVAAEPLSKSWPEPNYQKLIDDGADPQVVAIARALRDDISSKPRRSVALKRWARKVDEFRTIAFDLMSGKTSAIKVTENLELQGIFDMASLYELVGHEKSLKGLNVSAGKYTLFRGQKYKPPKTIWAIERKAKATVFSNMPTQLFTADTREELFNKFKDQYATMDLTVKKSSVVRFDIYSKRSNGKIFIGKKIGRHVAELKFFDTFEEARAYKKDHHDDLVKLLEKYKNIPNERKDTNSPRVGQDYRNGQDVTPEMFADAFGFRGVQFGNYVEDSRRQEDLNQAYDALMDMAGILGIPAKSLSLNGSLGLAFGARGKGGKHSAAAHYESGQVVINLTKRAGAGSLAHEWFHALDNYLLGKQGKREFLTDVRGNTAEGVRPEIVKAYKDIVSMFSKTALKERSRQLDKRRSKPYWETRREMAARSFETYVIEKLRDQGQANDYLANIVPEEMYQITEGYPYPLTAEMPEVRAVFDNLFQTIETKETDKGIALYARPKGQKTNNVTFAQAKAIVDRLRSVLADDVLIEAVESEQDLPAKIQQRIGKDKANGTPGFFLDGKIWIISDNVPNSGYILSEVFRHEMTHAGLKKLRTKLADAYGGDIAQANKAVDTVLNQVYIAKIKEIRKMATGQYKGGFNLRTGEGRRGLAEEWLAEQGRDSKWYDRYVAALVRFFRAVRARFGVDTKITDAEIRTLLQDARGSLLKNTRTNIDAYSVSDKHGDLLAPNDDRIMYSRPKNSVKSKIMGAEGIDPEITERFKTGDLGRLAEIFKLPYWLGKKFPAIGKMVDAYYRGIERKADMASRSLAEVEDLWKLPKEKMKELSGIVQAHDGKPIKSITSKKFIRRMDENNNPVTVNGRVALDLNPKYQEDFKAYVDTLKASPEVKKAFVDLRESLDNDLLRAYSKMLEMKDVDGGVIQEMRTNINQVHNYFPHHRYGKYYVRAVDSEGNVVFRTHYDAVPTRHKAEGLKIIAKMKKEHPGARWEMGINQKLPDEIYDFPIPVEAMEQIIMAAGKSLDKDTQKAFEQIMPEAVANVMKSRGWGSHMIHRNDIPGHETEDIQRVLLDYKTGLSGWIAKMETSRELGNIMRSVKGDKTPNLYRYCQQYMQDVLRNQDDIDKTVGKVKAATFAWYLGGNIKTAMLNLTQNIIVGWPTLAQHTGGSGVKMMDATMKKIIKSRLTANETKLLDDLIHSGITTDNYLRWIRGQVGGGSITDKALHVLGLPMSFAERFNRSSMALAAFRAMRDGKIINKKTLEKYGLKKGEKADYATAREFASDMVRDAHYLYGKGNMPQPLRSSTAGRAASPIFTFRTFTANTVLAWEQMLFHMGKEGRKAFARSMLATISLGGLTAIPLYATIKQVLQTALESDDDPVEEWAEQFDEQTTNMLLYGVPALAGVSLKGSISMETPFTGIVDNKSNKVLTNILGVTYDLLVDKPSRAWDAYKYSDYSRMVEEAMPTFIANGIKAFRLYNEGQTTVTGTTIPDETGKPRKINKSEAIGKVIGFQPVKLSRDYEKYHSGQVTKKLRSDKQGEIASEAVSAVRSGDRKAFRKAMEKLYAWNKKQYAKGNIHLILKPSNVNASIKRRLSGQSDPWYLKIKESGK